MLHRCEVDALACGSREFVIIEYQSSVGYALYYEFGLMATDIDGTADKP